MVFSRAFLLADVQHVKMLGKQRIASYVYTQLASTIASKPLSVVKTIEMLHAIQFTRSEFTRTRTRARKSQKFRACNE